MEKESYYLELSSSPVRFEAVNQLTNVFFDDTNKDVFTVRSGGIMGVVVKNANPEFQSLNFRMEDSGPLLSIKFSLDHKVLTVQRTTSSVEFMNFDGNVLSTKYTQSCRKTSNILGFVWSCTNEVALITDHGIELHMVLPEKKSVKHLKTVSATVQWFVWCSVNKLALLASSHGSHLLPVFVRQGCVIKLPKVETDPGRMALERDVTIATLYGTPAVLILRHHNGRGTAEVHIHTLDGPGQAPVKSHVLKLAVSGRFAINVVDDMVLVHHQASRSSLVFDTSLAGESDGVVHYHTPVVPPKSIKPVTLSLPGITEPHTHLCDLYSPNWVVFQPDIVIDAKLGCLWHISLRLQDLCTQIPDLNICTQVTLKRTNGKSVLLKLLLDTVQQDNIPLDNLHESFNHINQVYREWYEAKLQSQIASPPNVPLVVKSTMKPRVLIDQEDIYNEIFQKLDPGKDVRKMEWLLISYLTSLSECNINAQSYLNELLIGILANQRKFSELQQLLQYGVVSDSKQLACLLLSLCNLHPAASQLALDMLKRLGAVEEIQEILISEGDIVSALKVAGNQANPRKFLSLAEQSGNTTLFHTILTYFRNSPSGAVMFEKDPRLVTFVEEYNAMFNKK